ncbi:hypothetical protein Lepto7376_0891 [[Leptolyngbya] sp. PCC 7376]|uniref:DUF5837 family cyanobactin class RiPP n=1 Tax=[Leptolyngbya] sp. PCC 7376 TaxID=111781 RepID=UPI00029F264C|nr:DUF5837 family cyanobactin class RiPP [[Leptolyngbya] sp. PCC 7376]AFY37271.1 hypothetical protein Lepto7376_0891 [[Leptolyngbya] sp. PCC 7376]
MKRKNLQPQTTKPVVRITSGIKDDLLNDFPEGAVDVNGAMITSSNYLRTLLGFTNGYPMF